MIELHCRLYDGRTAQSRRTTVRIYEDGTVVRGAPAPCTIRVQELAVSEPLGRLSRRLTFPDGSVCETDDHAALQRALRRRGDGRAGHWLHYLESRWRWAVAALLLSVGLVYVAIEDGMPWLAAQVAPRVPDAARLALGERALATFDESITEPSALSPARRQALRLRFEDLVAWADLGVEPRLEFRKADDLGANAFALPGGIVVVTDRLVELAQADDEVVAVMAHEIGHVAHRHGLRKALQNAGISLVVIAATGDVSWLATVIPTTLLAARYSREFEREADRCAARYLTVAGIPPRALVELLRRMRAEAGGGGRPGFLASHPGIDERAQLLREAP